MTVRFNGFPNKAASTIFVFLNNTRAFFPANNQNTNSCNDRIDVLYRHSEEGFDVGRITRDESKNDEPGPDKTEYKFSPHEAIIFQSGRLRESMIQILPVYQLDKKFKLRFLLDIFENVWSNGIFPFTEPYFPRIELVPRIFRNETLKGYRQCYSARDQSVELLLPSFCNNFRYSELLFNVHTHIYTYIQRKKERESEKEREMFSHHPWDSYALRYFVFYVYARKRCYDGGLSLGDPRSRTRQWNKEKKRGESAARMNRRDTGHFQTGEKKEEKEERRRERRKVPILLTFHSS